MALGVDGSIDGNGKPQWFKRTSDQSYHSPRAYLASACPFITVFTPRGESQSSKRSTTAVMNSPQLVLLIFIAVFVKARVANGL